MGILSGALPLFFLVFSLVFAVAAAQGGSGGGPARELWCVAKNNAEDAALESALDWTCGAGGADCGPIQNGGPCYDGSDLQRTASYAFNDYYHKHGPSDDNCNFANTAALTSLNPSHDGCKFPSRFTISANPVITNFLKNLKKDSQTITEGLTNYGVNSNPSLSFLNSLPFTRNWLILQGSIKWEKKIDTGKTKYISAEEAIMLSSGAPPSLKVSLPLPMIGSISSGNANLNGPVTVTDSADLKRLGFIDLLSSAINQASSL
ncbi:hypothetical protein BUALT_Bualt03G0189600 [Buddleja alternifolia]|uniref:X8 domain-containing protein n=1 Tax=Buddleja alternifolia TaxID=168488 RepID=A0AAV6Y327_9LAMI|nr:hypothetical protein BUALT_Bualt03G0189600 [Buddleja alternifolia]